jgi:hypothetical protein
VLLALLRDFIIFTRGHETQTTLGRELFSLLPSSSFFLLCGSLYGRLCALKRRAQQQFKLNYRSDGWKEGKRDTKKGSRVYYTSPQTLDVHSVLLRWVANSTRNPRQTNQQTKSNTFCFSQVCAAGLLQDSFLAVLHESNVAPNFLIDLAKNIKR